MTISLPPKGNDAIELGSHFAPLRTQAQATPNMTVTVAEGAFWTAGNEYQEFNGGTSPTIAAPSADAKWVLLTLTSNGALNVVDGVASANPTLPDVALYKDELPLAALFIGDTVTAITNEMIYDLRPLWQVPPDSVSQTQLNDFATITYVDNGLATKAETTGTNEANFTLNVGGGSINDSRLIVDRQAGPDVAIRFNELAMTGSPLTNTPQWEFTNDGTIWNAIGVTAGSYYLISALDAGALDFRYYTQNDLSSTGVLDSRYYTETEADALFAVIAHTHVTADITDLAPQVATVNTIAPVLGDVSLNANDILDIFNVAPSDKHVLIYNNTNSRYENTLVVTDNLGDVDTSTTTPVAGDVLINNGGTFINRQLLTADISDFTGGNFVLTTNLAGDAPAGDGPPDSNGTDQDIYGVKTFKDGVTIEASLTITGTNTAIQTAQLVVTDPNVDINAGEAGPGVGGGTGTAGIRIDRGDNFGTGSPALNPPAIIQWDENAGQWEIGVEGNVSQIISGSHQHTVSDITDFGPGVTTQLALNDLNAIQDVTYLAAPIDGDHLSYNFSLTRWENSVFSTDVTTELNANTLEEIQDVTYAGASGGEFLIYQASPAMWINHTLTLADVSDFVGTDFLHTTGDETKVGSLVITGNFTTSVGAGSQTRLQSEHVYVTDTIVTINADETGTGVAGGGGTAGIEIERGSFDNSYLLWNDSSGTWTITQGAASPQTTETIEVVGHTHLLADVTDVSSTAAEVNFSVGVTSAIQTQIDTKISRTGDTMGNAANLTFAATGEVLGLPAVPSVDGAAASKKYVDDQITIGAGDLATHEADFTVHLTAQQNTFLDTLDINGSPTSLTAADVNQLSGITGNVQTLLDAKADKTGAPATTGNFAALDATGNLIDSLIITNDSASNLTTIWTSSKIDTTKTDKIVPALNGNLAGLSTPNGDLTDSGFIVNDGGTAATELWSASKIDGQKTDKIVPALTNNLALLDAAGNLGDSGVIVNDLGTLTSEIWTASKIDTTKADKIAPALASNLAGLNAGGNLIDSGVIVNDAGVLTSEIWTASKIDTTKMDKLSGVAGNFAEFNGTGNVVDNGTNAATFAAAAHTHVVANVTDFAAGVTTELAANNLNALQDVAVPVPTALDVIQRNAGNTAWVNASVFTVMGTDFVRKSGSIAESITGVKTFNDDSSFGANVIITGDLTVNGTTTTLDSQNLQVSDKNITVNFGYIGPTSGSTGSGIHVNRNQTGFGSPPVLDLATMIWDDAITRWKGGLEGSETPFALEGQTVAQPFWEMIQAPLVGSPALIASIYTLSFGVPTPVAGTTGVQVFVNGVKQIEGGTKAYTVSYANPSQTVVTFNSGSEPTLGADVEFYGFGYIA